MLDGQICLERMKQQIKSRFVAVEEPKTYVPLYLDPRTVPYVNQVIPDTLKEGTLQLFTEMVTHVLKVMSAPRQSTCHHLGSSCANGSPGTASTEARASADVYEQSAGDSGSEADLDMDNNFVLKPSSGDLIARARCSWW